MLVLLAADMVGYLLGLLVLTDSLGLEWVMGGKEAALLGWLLVVAASLNYFLRLYHNLWQLVSLRDLFRLFLSAFLSTALLGLICAINGFNTIVYTAGYLSFLSIYFLVMLSTRLVIRAAYRYTALSHIPVNTNRILLVGAGAAGELVLQEAEKNPSVGTIVGIVDDDPNKQNMYFYGKQVLGYTKDIPAICRKYAIDEIIIAIPSAPGKQVREWMELCAQANCRCRIVPKNVMTSGSSFRWRTIRQIEIEDLLDRPPVTMDEELVGRFLQGQTVLVTGGGGSIGSELCRQISRFPVKQLIVFDIYENNAYELQQELKYTCPDLDLVVSIGSVRDKDRLHQVFSAYRPTVVFHAAAHKHVPLMEDNPYEAVKNNVLGTWNVAQASLTYGVKKFILISTDKAVNPTNVMGCTKRIAEMIVQSQNRLGSTIFAAVRFGNVLGSNGSVMEVFKKQIAKGGPVTVTSEDVIRYFMTIPEAAQLVLQAGAMAQGSEIFVLDMGEPVRIIDLAKKMIQLAGFTPEDIPIQIIGLRPGEKLYEELLHNSENDACTKHEKIYVSKVEPVSLSTVEYILNTLQQALEQPETDIRQVLQQLVPSYCPGNGASLHADEKVLSKS